MLKLIDKLRAIPKWVAVLVSLILVGVLGIADYVTGPEVSFSIFYLAPISLVTLACGWPFGLVVCGASALTWLCADLTAGHDYSHAVTPYWNAAVRLGYFALHTSLLSGLVGLIQRGKGLARMDPLTQIANWQHFEEYACRELQRSRRAERPLTMVYIDLDDFKAVNDTLGREVGDRLLQTVADMIEAAIRASDMVARVGGDEFAVILSEADYPGAESLLLRLHESLLDEMKRHEWPVTISIGAMTFRDVPPSVDELVKRADELMYEAKRDGKNCIKHKEWPSTSVPP